MSTEKEKALKMLNAKVLNAREFEAIIPVLIATEEHKIIKRCLKVFDEIPDKSLVDLLKYILVTDDDVFQSIYKTSQDSVLDLLLSKPFTDLHILSPLKQLPFTHILTLLKFLQTRLFWSQNKSDHSQLTFVKAVEWINIVIDSHYPQCFTKDALQILVELHQMVTDQLEIADEIHQLSTVIEVITSKTAVPTRMCRQNDSYSIETISIK